MTKTLYMVGHSNHDWPTFERLLLAHQITVLIDVRSTPRSRFATFNQGALTRRLADVSIAYQHWPSLGGKFERPVPTVKRELERLLADVGEHRLCLMCSEGDHRDCHRHTLLTPIALELGWTVMQIQKHGTAVADLGPAPQLQLG